MLTVLERAARTVDVVLRKIVSVIVFAMMVAIVADATGRAFNHPIPGVTEVTEEYLMVAVVFLALGFTHSAGRHIGIDLFRRFWPVIGHRFVRMTVDLLGAGYFALIAWYAGDQTAYALSIGQRSSSELAYPLAPAFALVVLGASIMSLWLLLDVALTAAGRPPQRETSEGAM